MSHRAAAMFRRASGPVLLVLAIVASANIAGAPLIERFQSGVAVLMNLGSAATMQSLRELQTQYGGERVLPPQVQDMLQLLRNNGVQTYMLSRGIAESEIMSQRITEGAFPILHVDSSPYLLSSASEAPPANCSLLATAREVTLARCN